MSDNMILTEADKAGRSFEDLVTWLRSMGISEFRIRTMPESKRVEIEVRCAIGIEEKRLANAIPYKELDYSRIPLVGLTISDMAVHFGRVAPEEVSGPHPSERGGKR